MELIQTLHFPGCQWNYSEVDKLRREIGYLCYKNFATYQNNEYVIVSSGTTKCIWWKDRRKKYILKTTTKKQLFIILSSQELFPCKSHFFIKTVIEKGHAVQQVQFLYMPYKSHDVSKNEIHINHWRPNPPDVRSIFREMFSSETPVSALKMRF